MSAGDFASLNPEQRLVVDTTSRPVLVMAPVGTGKTRVLALRAARALASGAEASHILCLSFTNKAAREMQARLSAVFGKSASGITAKTFHGLCAFILRAEARTLGIDGDFLIYDEEDTAELLARLWKRANVRVDPRDAEKLYFLLGSAVSLARLSRYDDPEPRKPQQIFENLLRQSSWGAYLLREKVDFAHILRDYVHELRENHALDFTDLVAGVNRLWDEHPPVLAAWGQRFAWIQVDEVQDTSRAEYRILKALAEPHGQLSFFGDIDQTIYEWRGSAPFDILDDYRKRFQPEEIQLVRNYRSTRAILTACASLIRACPGAVTAQIVAQEAEEGEPLRIEQAANPAAEAEWIASRIRGLRKLPGIRYRDFAILTRTNFYARDISRVFERLRVPHVQVEQQKFFQRAEVKAALAHLRLLINPHDGNSLMRFLKTPPKGIGEVAIEKLRGEPRRAGLKLGDLLDPAALEAGDPYAGLLRALRDGEVVVFDTETTGTDTSVDEIIELAGARCDAAGVRETFHAFLRPSRPVGASQRVHGWSDEHLAAHGRDPADVIEEFRRFCGGALLAGHNSRSFDVPMLESASRRLGLASWFGAAQCDTLDLTRRLHRLPRYRLSDIATALHLPSRPTHHALDDVLTTVELLRKLAAQLEESAATRREAIASHGSKFKPVASRLARWRERMQVERPHELLRRVLDESGLTEHFAEEQDGAKRLANLTELCRIVEANDAPELPPAAALVQILSVASLGNDVERQAVEEDRVLIMTVHQAKGLEFDTVFIAGAADDEFPSFRSKREGRYDEEHRLFYVAASRARRRLFVTWSKTNEWGRSRQPSPFLELLKRDEASATPAR